MHKRQKPRSSSPPETRPQDQVSLAAETPDSLEGHHSPIPSDPSTPIIADETLSAVAEDAAKDAASADNLKTSLRARFGSSLIHIGQAVGSTAVQAGQAAAQAGHATADKVVTAGKAVGGTTVQATHAVAGTTAGVSHAVGSAAGKAGHMVADKARAVGTTVGGAALTAGHAVTDKAAGAGIAVTQAAKVAGNRAKGAAQGVGTAAVGTGRTVVQKGVGASSAVTAAAAQVARTSGHAIADSAASFKDVAADHALPLVESAAQRTGQVAELVIKNPALQSLIKSIRAQGWIELLSRVDLDRAESSVAEMKQQYPGENARQIARRLMVQKALYAGGVGLSTSAAPGAAAVLLAVDWSVTALLQAELVYQIAAVHGLDIRDPARKGEVLAIFGLTLGGGRAVKAGLELLRAAPVAGAVITASANAVLVYALGYAALHFYENKLHLDASTASIQTAQQENDRYLDTAVCQEVVVDQILVLMILAGNPGKCWSEILPDLEAAELSPESLATIAANLQSPQPLEDLLSRLNSDYAVTLLAQCHKLAELDGAITSAEAQILDAVATKFELALAGRDKSMADFLEFREPERRDRDEPARPASGPALSS